MAINTPTVRPRCVSWAGRGVRRFLAGSPPDRASPHADQRYHSSGVGAAWRLWSAVAVLRASQRPPRSITATTLHTPGVHGVPIDGRYGQRRPRPAFRHRRHPFRHRRHSVPAPPTSVPAPSTSGRSTLTAPDAYNQASSGENPHTTPNHPPGLCKSRCLDQQNPETRGAHHNSKIGGGVRPVRIAVAGRVATATTAEGVRPVRIPVARRVAHQPRRRSLGGSCTRAGSGSSAPKSPGAALPQGFGTTDQASTASRRFFVTFGSTGTPGPMVVVTVTFLRYLPFAADGLARMTSSSTAA